METIHAIVGTILWAVALAAGIYGFGYWFERGRRSVGKEVVDVHIASAKFIAPADGLLVRIAKTSGKTKKTR
jgi:hypothetical protein